MHDSMELDDNTQTHQHMQYWTFLEFVVQESCQEVEAVIKFLQPQVCYIL